MKFKSIILALITAALGGCASYSMQTASAPISASRASHIVDGQSTRIDVISLFGNPNGFNPSIGVGAVGAITMPQQYGQDAPKTDNILHYKDCITTTTSKAGLIAGSFFIPRSSMVEVCKVFTALLDEHDTVVAHVYLENNLVTKEKLARIKEGVSNKQVIRTLGGPSSILPSSDNQIYIYKTCISKAAKRSWNPYQYDMKNRQSCQQATIVMDKNSMVIKVNFIPWDDTPL